MVNVAFSSSSMVNDPLTMSLAVKRRMYAKQFVTFCSELKRVSMSANRADSLDVAKVLRISLHTSGSSSLMVRSDSGYSNGDFARNFGQNHHSKDSRILSGINPREIKSAGLNFPLMCFQINCAVSS
jgi:hypothetical protein